MSAERENGDLRQQVIDLTHANRKYREQIDKMKAEVERQRRFKKRYRRQLAAEA